MPRERKPVEPAPPEAAAELGRCLDAMNFDLTSLFLRPGNCMTDPDVLAAAASITRSKRPMRAPHGG